MLKDMLLRGTGKIHERLQLSSDMRRGQSGTAASTGFRLYASRSLGVNKKNRLGEDEIVVNRVVFPDV